MKQVSLIIKQLVEEKLESFLQAVDDNSSKVPLVEAIDLPDFEDFLALSEEYDKDIAEQGATIEIQKELDRHLNALEKDLDQYRKVVVIIGSHSSGKTTLFNQITGLKMPTGRSENTGRLVECVIAKRKRLKVYFKDGTIKLLAYNQKKLARLVDKFSQQEHGKVFDKEISKIRIMHPFENFSPDTLLVDTPGINGLAYSKLFKEVTLPYLRQLPNQKTKVIWVQDLVKAETSELEFQILNNLPQFGKSVLFVGTNYDNYLRSGHWEELMMQFESPIYSDANGNKQSLKSIFSNNIYISTLVGEKKHFRRIDETEAESRKTLRKSLIKQWIGTDWIEAKGLFERSVKSFWQITDKVDSYFTNLANKDLELFDNQMNQRFLNSESFKQMQLFCHQQLYDIINLSIDIDDNNELSPNKRALVIEKDTLAQMQLAIQSGSENFYQEIVFEQIERVCEYAQTFEVNISKELSFFSFINQVSYRRFLQDEEKSILKFLDKQFKQLRIAILKGGYSRKQSIREAVRLNYFHEDKFLFLLNWFNIYKCNHSALIASLKRKFVKALKK